MKAAWICLVICVAAGAPACRESMHPVVDEQSTTNGSHTQPELGEGSNESQRKSAMEPGTQQAQEQAKAAPGADDDKVVRAHSHEEQGADVTIKAPPGWQVATSAPDTKDPHNGKFTLVQALKGLSGKGKLYASIQTSMGRFECQLFDDKAPKTVANFVGLARGLRKFWSPKDKAWVARPYYDGTTFHRVIPEFMIQGGDWKGDGSGNMYFTVPDELHPSLKHDRGGLLCMANRGPNTNEAQFFITEAAAPHLDSSYTIFGECSPIALVKRIARVPQSGPPNNRPLTPVVIQKVTIERHQAGPRVAPAASTSAPKVPKGEAVRVPAPKTSE